VTDSVRSPAPRWRLAGWCTVAVCTIAAGVGLASLRIDDDLRSLLRDGSADFAVMDEVAAIFGPRDRECLVRATARQGDVFAAGTLESLATLAEQLRQVEGVAAVRSMFDVRRQRGPCSR
jgi:predicted RND superfamily exporter protein